MVFSVLIERSLAELEWILPVCREIKAREQNVKIHLLFLAYNKNDIVGKNTFIMSLVNEIFDDCSDLRDCLPPPASWVCDLTHTLKDCLLKKKKSTSYNRSQMIVDINTMASSNSKKATPHSPRSLRNCMAIIYRWFESKTISLLLRRFIISNKSTLLFKQARSNPIKAIDSAILLLRSRKGTRTVGYPQSSRLHLSTPPRNEDLLFFNTDPERDHSSKSKNIQGRLVTVGVPRYDNDWISHVAIKFDQERQYFLKKKYSKFFLVNLQKEYAWIFSWKRFETYLDEILDVLSSYEEAIIIFKPHPSQNIQYLEHRLASRNMPERLQISHSSSLALATMADLIITMPSTSIFDLIPSGKSVIEYYDYSSFKKYKDHCAGQKELSDFDKTTSSWAIYSEKHGHPSSIYRDMGFVEGASDQRTIEALVRKFLNCKESKGFKHFQNYFPSDAASKAAKEVLSFMNSAT